MLRAIAIIFGLFFVVIGVSGFIPRLSPNHMLFGIFLVNGVDNIVHLITGILSLWVGFTSTRASRVYFQVFSVIYVIMAIAGFFYGPGLMVQILANNRADAWLHLSIAIVSLYLTFGFKGRVG